MSWWRQTAGCSLRFNIVRLPCAHPDWQAVTKRHGSLFQVPGSPWQRSWIYFGTLTPGPAWRRFRFPKSDRKGVHGSLPAFLPAAGWLSRSYESATATSATTAPHGAAPAGAPLIAEVAAAARREPIVTKLQSPTATTTGSLDPVRPRLRINLRWTWTWTWSACTVPLPVREYHCPPLHLHPLQPHAAPHRPREIGTRDSNTHPILFPVSFACCLSVSLPPHRQPD